MGRIAFLSFLIFPFPVLIPNSSFFIFVHHGTARRHDRYQVAVPKRSRVRPQPSSPP